MAIKNKKGSGHTEELSKELMAQLNCDTAFTIPLFGGIPVAESVVVTWIIMAVLLIAAAILGRNLKVENVGKKQLVLETIVGGLYNFFRSRTGSAIWGRMASMSSRSFFMSPRMSSATVWPSAS